MSAAHEEQRSSTSRGCQTTWKCIYSIPHTEPRDVLLITDYVRPIMLLTGKTFFLTKRPRRVVLPTMYAGFSYLILGCMHGRRWSYYLLFHIYIISSWPVIVVLILCQEIVLSYHCVVFRWCHALIFRMRGDTVCNHFM